MQMQVYLEWPGFLLNFLQGNDEMDSCGMLEPMEKGKHEGEQVRSSYFESHG